MGLRQGERSFIIKCIKSINLAYSVPLWLFYLFHSHIIPFSIEIYVNILWHLPGFQSVTFYSCLLMPGVIKEGVHLILRRGRGEEVPSSHTKAAVNRFTEPNMASYNSDYTCFEEWVIYAVFPAVLISQFWVAGQQENSNVPQGVIQEQPWHIPQFAPNSPRLSSLPI